MIRSKPLVQAQGLKKYFPIARNLFLRPTDFVRAVDGVSLELREGEVVGLVGQSGCGKTTVAKMLVKLLEPTEGNIKLREDGDRWLDVGTLRGTSVKRFRRRVQMVFQDPYESMNPRLTVYDTVAEPLVVQGIGEISERREQVAKMLALVGLSPPTTFMFRYPHELSGGQRQRVAIGRALILRPSFVVADEPTSMLDVSVRAEVIKLMQRLGERFGITYLYITHDLAVARYLCHRIAVMNEGRIVEEGDTEEVLQHPQHPYTQSLIAAVPDPRSQGW